MNRQHTGSLGAITLALACGVLTQGCRDDDGGGTFINVSGGGSTGTSGGTSPVQGGSFTLVVSDPGGGTILESADGTQRKIAGTFHDNVTFDSKYSWVLDAPVFFGDEDATQSPTLTIQPGTTILGRGGTPPSMLVIRRSATINANGTSAQPIVFTSAQPAGSRAAGDWGGLVINGQAPVNDLGSGGELPFGEGGSGKYGGTTPTHSSGTLRYVRVEFGGHVFTSNDELNGIAFQGVGSGTTVEFIQVHKNADDGIEFFGGTVNAKNVLITACQDDSLDWTSGWTGKIQFLVVQQWAGGADNGIEADNLEGKNDATPRSHPVICNATFVGPADGAAASDIGLLFRRGTGINLHNAIVLGFNEFGLDIDNDATWDNAYADAPATYTTLSGELTVSNTFFFDNALGNFQDDAADPQTDTAFNGHQTGLANTLATDPLLTDPQDEAAPDFRPQAGSPVLGAWDDPVDGFFTPVTFSGAMDETTNWAAGWSAAPSN